MAGWSNGVRLTVTGYLAGIPIAQVNFTISSAKQAKIPLPSGWPLVQTMVLTTSGGTPGPYDSIPFEEVSPYYTEPYTLPAMELSKLLMRP